MALIAMAIPILPGKTEQWRKFVDQVTGPRNAEFQASRRGLGVHERTFFQPTPMGDLVVVTLEGADPVGALRRFANGTDEFTRWFLQQAREIHGLDLAQVAQGPEPQLIADSDVKQQKKAA